MITSKTIARKYLFPFITRFSIEKLLSKFSKNRLILVYHGVNPNPDFTLNGRHIEAKQFEAHLKYYKENFNVVSLSEMFDMYRSDFIPKKKTIAITFDDGYENNCTHALPLLDKYDVPATFFVLSACLQKDGEIAWPDLIDVIRKYSGLGTLAVNEHVFLNNGKEYFSTMLKMNIYDFFKNMGSERNELLDSIAREANIDRILHTVNSADWSLMSKNQLIQCASKNIEIGSHTHEHYNLANISKELVREELKISKNMLEIALQKEVKSIAYPDGSYTAEVKKISLEVGYKDLLAVNYKCENDPSDKNILPRYCISNTTTFESNMIQVNLNFKKTGF